MRILLTQFHHFVYCTFPILATIHKWTCKFESDIQRAILKACSHPGITSRNRLKKAIKLCRKIAVEPQLFDYYVN